MKSELRFDVGEEPERQCVSQEEYYTLPLGVSDGPRGPAPPRGLLRHRCQQEVMDEYLSVDASLIQLKAGSQTNFFIFFFPTVNSETKPSKILHQRFFLRAFVLHWTAAFF